MGGTRFSLFISLTFLSSWICGCEGTASIKDLILGAKHEFCPGVDICKDDISTVSPLVNFSNMFWSCCTECNCRSNCTQDNTCCFPPKRPKVNARIEFGYLEIVEECLYQTTIQQNLVDTIEYESFNMVTAVIELRIPDQRMNTTIQCGDEIVAQWGSMYPVYSSTKQTIYKNVKCAEAHGVTDGLMWDAVVNCKASYTNIEAGVSIVEFQTSNFSQCSVDFIPPVDIENITGLKCYASLVNNCSLTEFKPSLEIELSQINVKEMCESGFVSPFRVDKLYANVFCYICNTYFLPYALNCNSSLDENRDVYISRFIGLIDNTLIHPNDGESSEQVINPTVCDSIVADKCRPVFCPTGQLRDKSGRCKYLNKLWYNQVYVVNINLTSEIRFDISEINDITKSLSGLTESMRKIWKIDFIAYETNQYDRNGASLLIILNYKTKEIRPQVLMRQIKRLLLLQWMIDLNNDTLPLKSRFSNCLGYYINPYQHRFENHSRHIPAPIHQKLYENKMFLRNKHYITKLNLCKQVELSSFEFEVSFLREVIFNKKTEIFMFNGEFLIYAKNNSFGEVARICIEDSGISETKNESSKMPTKFCIIMIFISLIMVESFYGNVF